MWPARSLRAHRDHHFQFLYSEAGRRLPIAMTAGSLLAPRHRGHSQRCNRRKQRARRLAIGGKSMGGRIASQVAATDPDEIAGLVFLGYPLHPPGRPDKLRSKHLPEIRRDAVRAGLARCLRHSDELAPIMRR
jgi:predicted alpha/beta-hydrolase family hydrolase